MTTLSFAAEIIYWRGPSPFFYAPVPLEHAAALREAAKRASYGWGVIPVEATIGEVVFTTSLFPKDGSYLVPIKAEVRRKANVTAGDLIAVGLTVQTPRL